ncbi:pyrroline-5-carboxylate reductase [Microbacterium sp. No. 7]|uniref:pyrroline-5-carboxylate reductase n=1 Tax=Microbacterium sp. No. 7 TaxID=1714373 RepID=UPI0006D28EAE|nr:pyrroline-5-carboxylate reductase [Microbacterium sp. No. 7]ALJ21507.1 pyrroline-5-carboxylate reductase [Microbacterium sp. No. 7]
MSAHFPPIAILGAGSMGGAVARGIVRSGRASDVIVTNRSRRSADALADLPGVRSIALEETPTGNADAVAAADVVMIGVKPDMVVDLLREIAPVLRPRAVVVSLAAGLTTTRFAAVLGDEAAVVRAMPNTPALVGEAVTGLAAGETVTAEQRALVHELFATCGSVIEIAEEQIDALSTISGSGPAYVYLLIEALTEAARGKGFTDEEARLMAEQTFIGATALLKSSGGDPAELRRRVTSPKGTTERAVAVLRSANLEGLFAEATDAALARARQLAAE